VGVRISPCLYFRGSTAGHLSTQRMVMFGGLNDWLATVTVMQTEQIISFLLQQDPAATSHWFWKS